MRNLTPLLFLSLVAVAFTLSPAHAAPQILGLVASAEPVPLTCEGGTCSAEITSICLQKSRPAPVYGTAYKLAKNSRISLVVTGSDGKKKTFPIAEHVEIKSFSMYHSVSLRVPEDVVSRLGKGEAAVMIEPLASATPVALKDDPKPLSAREIRRYTGPLRVVAGRAFEADHVRVAATQFLNQMVNQLPADNSAGIEKLPSVLNKVNAQRQPPAAARLTKAAINECRELLRKDISPGLRSCLSHQHDIITSETNNKVWKALKPGS
jgi:hypothetical protein